MLGAEPDLDLLMHRYPALGRAAPRRAVQPGIVLHAWAPRGSDFEAEVFRDPSLHTYIVITGASRANASDRGAYETQSDVKQHEDRQVGRTALPSGTCKVIIFQRRSHVRGAGS